MALGYFWVLFLWDFEWIFMVNFANLARNSRKFVIICALNTKGKAMNTTLQTPQKAADFAQNADSQGIYKISPADEKRLQETLELRKQGKLRYFSLDESLKMSDERLKELGANL